MENKIKINSFIFENVYQKEMIEEFLINELNIIDDINRKLFYQEMVAREASGNIQIAENVILPHVESKLISNSQVIVIKLLSPISAWNQSIAEVSLIIGVFLTENESLENKKTISNFMRRLADDEYIEKLLNTKTKNQLEKNLGGI